MNGAVRKIAVWLLVLCVLTACLQGCSSAPEHASFDIASVESYTGIPGVTQAEIDAVEMLKASRSGFVYGSMLTTETFEKPDGTAAGFSALLCEELSNLFGIPFTPGIYAWDALGAGFADYSIDFTGELTATPERAQLYRMSSPITQRALGVFFNNESSVNIKTEKDLNGLKVAFLSGTITERSIRRHYPALIFTASEAADISEAAEKLQSREIDAFITDAVAAISFADYGFISAANVLPLVYTPVSMTAANPELAPVISVVDKYIAAGGNQKLDEIYAAGEREYAKNEFGALLNEKETAWLNSLAANGENVPAALENANYPISFYNEKAGEYQGIVPDMLSEINALTGISFEIKSSFGMSWNDILGMLSTGEASLVSELLRTPARQDRFLWGRKPYYSSRYVLLSKADYPNLKLYQVSNAVVGMVNGSAAAYEFFNWFPEKDYLMFYETENEALDALENGEIDLFCKLLAFFTLK